jgi:transcriptional regulator with XRE-family HTH domain
MVRQKDDIDSMSEKPFPKFLEFEHSRLFVSQEQMAILCGVSPVTVYRWLHGRRKPSFLEEYALRRFLPSLGCGCAEILLARNASAVSARARAPLASCEPVERSSKPERSAIVERSEVPPERPTGEVPPEEPKPAPRVAPFPPAPRPPINPGHFNPKHFKRPF